VVTVIVGTEITARFESGRLTGSAGCNMYTAAYTVGGNALTISPAASTRRACSAPAGIMEQEATYLAALTTTAAYRIEGDRLILETADGARVASFLAAAAALSSEEGRDAPGDANAKITFDLTAIDDAGLVGAADGKVAVAYEFCIPATPPRLTDVQGIDPTVRPQAGAPGRIGCGPDELLCVGSTHQPNWRIVLGNLAALDYVARIDRSFAE
jgi:heat shock protein HslJ